MATAEPAPLSCLVRGSGPAVMLVHGGGATRENTYGPLIGALAQDNTVIAPDYSQAPAGAAADLDGLTDLHVAAAVRAGHERFVVAGHSLGCLVAVKAAIRHPERVVGLVLTAGFARAAMSMRLKVQLWRALLDGDRDVLARFLMSVTFSDRYLNAMTQDQVDGFVDLIGLSLRPGTAEQIELVLNADVRGQLGRVHVPTLVVATMADRLVPPLSSVEIADGIPGARLAELDCGHQPALERAAEWSRLIKEFCGSEFVDGRVPR
ncbi:alpha/beta fold hydrolase [Streptomyces sp. 8L]|uniref:alpha/beta fold hydrolase n=1 Tax=Streptomyces sp. 8L TaxID=2877242 RepID=UPI001CD5715D|nr:alpha/beta hydrolase [Streptomyces sp. 8L]MCA1220282.1 alpha/beta hydrolase [Streptomyces sp. 8L]